MRAGSSLLSLRGQGMTRSTGTTLGVALTCLLSTAALSAPELVALEAPPPPELLPMTGITVTKVSIEAGRLIVEGKTAKPKTAVTVERRWSVTSSNKNVFRFSLLYVPADCIIEFSTAAGGVDEAAVSN